jgi:hypothetical protein
MRNSTISAMSSGSPNVFISASSKLPLWADWDPNRANRLLIPEYSEASCLAGHGAPRHSTDITGGKREGGKLGDLGGAISAAIYLK